MTNRLLTRRQVFQSAGMVIGAAAFPPEVTFAAQARPAAADPPISPIMTRLSTYMSGARDHALPDDVVEIAKRHILDTFAAIVSGSELLPGRAAIKFARAYGGQKLATVAASNVLCGPIEAALANGVMGHADETDDYWFQNGWHPGSNVVPAALAVGEQFGISGTDFLRAVVLGYDIGARFMMTMRPKLSESHRDPHGSVGAFAAAAAAGSAARLTAQQMRWLIDYTVQQSSGTAGWARDTDHIEKGFVFGGMPARNGVTGALLVHAGWTAVDDILSGQDNFVLTTGQEVDPAGLVDKLGERYEVTRTHMKKWSVGAPIQAPLDAMEIILKKRPFEADQVKEVVVRMAPGSVADNREMPDVNTQYMIAVMLVDKTATFRSAHDVERMQDPAILRQRAKVRLVAGSPAGRGAAGQPPLVVVTLTDGTRLSEDVTAVLGTIDNPMTHDQLVAKCRDLITPVLGAATCTRLIDTVFGLEKLKDIRALRPLLQRA